MDLLGYTIETLSGGTERITAEYDVSGESVFSIVEIAPERASLPLLSSFTAFSTQNRVLRASKEFVDTVNALESFNGVTRSTAIYRSIFEDVGTLCEASISSEVQDSTEWEIGLENPDDGSATARFTNIDFEFWNLIEVSCVLKNDVDGQVGRAELAVDAGPGAVITYNLLSGDASRDIQVNNGSTFTIDISPAGHTTSCGLAGCGAVILADLTYNGANGIVFAAAYKQAIINGIAADMSGIYGIDYLLDVEYSSAVLKIRFMNSNNHASLVYPRTPGGGALLQEGITRAAAAKGDDGDSTQCFYRENSLHVTQIGAWTCEGDTPCAPIVNLQTTNINCAGGTPGDSKIGTGGAITISGAKVTAICSGVKLTASADVTCQNPTFLWNTGETTQEIHVVSGAFWCEVTCGNQCVITAKIFI